MLRFSSLFSVGILFLSVAACGGSADKPQTDLESVTTPQSAADWALPLDRYIGGFDERKTLFQALDLLVGDCMREYGESWTNTTIKPTGLARAQQLLGAWRDEASIERYGYHPPDAEREAAELALGPQMFDPPGPGLTDDQMAVLTTVDGDLGSGKQGPEGGCAGAASKKLGWGGKPYDVFSLPETTEENALALTKVDSRVLAVEENWASCMKEAGFVYRSPAEAEADPRWSGEGSSGEQGSSAEFATAKADHACQVEVNYSGVRLAVLRAYEEQGIEENAPGFAQFESDLKKHLKKAAEIVSRG
ncbi:hypothetical protein [Actinocorallia sp. A-T 12471]|uniref:hypothetical protein n=1 Tax=Actinocorallia sp. A-T 12471 TaxID=3089813 RepID=UPI0029D09C2A|nr:hypothetical protein [Actinocorallia sp. A-T 12471]MDX6739126.1 hypothetical protein [Actinocorallia sp. A-T 12471]